MGGDGGNPKKQGTGEPGTKPWPRAVEPVKADGAEADAADRGPGSEPAEARGTSRDSAELDPFEGPAEHDPFEDLVGSGGSEAAFKETDARGRKGNFVVPFGLPGSGKTTFLASLFKYIDESENLTSRIVVPARGKVRHYAGQAMLNQWQKVFNTGRFPGATPVGGDAIRGLAYEVTPSKGQRTRLGFSVVEVSGEDLVRVVAREGSDPRLPDAVAALFRNANVRTMIVLVVHPNQLDNDPLFNNLFIWLNENVSRRLKTFSLAVLIANPDLALQRLHKRRPDTQGHEKLSGNILKLYLKEFAPKTHSMYNSWPKRRRAILPFRVGEIETRREGGETRERITRFNKRNSVQFFAWMYHQFTGRKLGPGFIRRLIRWLNG